MFDELTEEDALNAKSDILRWVTLSQLEKIDYIDQLKDLFIADGAYIRQSSEYYVNQFNIRIYHVIQDQQIESFKSVSFLELFKSMAIMEGDFDDGTDKIELIRSWYGEEGLNKFKDTFSSRYQEFMRDRSLNLK